MPTDPTPSPAAFEARLAEVQAEAANARGVVEALTAQRDDLKARLEHESAAAERARVQRDRLATQLRALTPGDESTASTTLRAAAPSAGPLPKWSKEDVELRITTDLSPDDLLALLEKWAPWRIEIIFSNGVRTSELETKQPFTLYPLSKMAMLEGVIDLERLRGGAALDIGSNCGYNAFHLASRYAMEVDGIDVETRHLEVAAFLSEVGNLALANFVIGDAQTFLRPRRYDLVLHFGTLYHLPNPLQSLERTAANLRPGGYLALETTCFHANDDRLVKYIRGYFGDDSNFWALSKPVLEDLLELYGFEEVRLVHQIDLEQLDPGLSRALYVARRAPAADVAE
jgi:SAM-dependent methyltransferase